MSPLSDIEQWSKLRDAIDEGMGNRNVGCIRHGNILRTHADTWLMMHIGRMPPNMCRGFFRKANGEPTDSGETFRRLDKSRGMFERTRAYCAEQQSPSPRQAGTLALSMSNLEVNGPANKAATALQKFVRGGRQRRFMRHGVIPAPNTHYEEQESARRKSRRAKVPYKRRIVLEAQRRWRGKDPKRLSKLADDMIKQAMTAELRARAVRTPSAIARNAMPNKLVEAKRYKSKREAAIARDDAKQKTDARLARASLKKSIFRKAMDAFKPNPSPFVRFAALPATFAKGNRVQHKGRPGTVEKVMYAPNKAPLISVRLNGKDQILETEPARLTPLTG